MMLSEALRIMNSIVRRRRRIPVINSPQKRRRNKCRTRYFYWPTCSSGVAGGGGGNIPGASYITRCAAVRTQTGALFNISWHQRETNSHLQVSNEHWTMKTHRMYSSPFHRLEYSSTSRRGDKLHKFPVNIRSLEVNLPPRKVNVAEQDETVRELSDTGKLINFLVQRR